MEVLQTRYERRHMVEPQSADKCPLPLHHGNTSIFSVLPCAGSSLQRWKWWWATCRMTCLMI